MAKKFREALIKSPTTLFFYAEHKIGKTMACLNLKDALLWDCQHGADAYSGDIDNISNYQDMIRSAEENKKNRDYKILVVDSIYDMIRFLAPIAVQSYKNALTGKQLDEAKVQDWYKNTDKMDPNLVLSLIGFAKGNEAVFETFAKFFNYLKTCFDKIIYIAHNKLGNSAAEKGNLLVKEIDLPMQIREYVLRYSDQVCIGSRKGNNLIMDFSQVSEGAKTGGRFDYLEGRKIVISNKEGEEYETFWHRIYPDVYGLSGEDVKQELDKLEEEARREREMLS